MPTRTSRRRTAGPRPAARLLRVGGPLLLACLAVSTVAGESLSTPLIEGSQLLGYVQLLASDDWEGRGTGTPGEESAARFIADHLEALGFEPAGEDGGWFQIVEVPAGYRLGPGNELALASGVPELDSFVLDRDFRPFGGSASARVEGELVFAGYGVRAKELDYDDYADLDVRGKIVVVFRHLPRGEGAWSGREARAAHAPFAAKLARAAEAGALALLVANDPASFPTAEEAKGRAGVRPRPDALERTGGGVGEAPIPFVHLTRAASTRLFALAFGKMPEDFESAIHAEGGPRPASRASDVRLRVTTEIEAQVALGRNVCARLRAGAPDAVDELVVVGAHHDHLGRGLPGSLARTPDERRQIHNGADDNASGTAGVLAVAGHLARQRERLRRDVLVMTFTGEERGLVGSRWFCEHPTVPLERIVAMVNMDMIGRLEGRPLFVGGEQTSPAFRAILDRRVEQAGLEVQYGPGGRAPSDNTSFYDKGKPVLFFFSGMHPDYHRPSDDWEKLDLEGMAAIARLAAGVVEDLACLPEAPAFRQADAGGFGPVRPVLGISVGPHVAGVRVEGLVPDGPAAQAGLQEGDVIVAIGGTPTPDVGALRAAMGKLKIGAKVAVTVRREGGELDVEVTLGRS